MLVPFRPIVAGCLLVGALLAPTTSADDVCHADSSDRRLLDAVDPTSLDEADPAWTESLASVLDHCPMLLASYDELVLRVDQPGFWTERYPTLARAVRARPLAERLEVLPTFWALEFRVLPIERYPEIRQRARRLEPRIAALDRHDDDRWWRAWIAATEIAGQAESAERLRSDHAAARPCATESIARALDEVAEQWTDSANRHEIEAGTITFPEIHRDAARAALTELARRCPDDPRPVAWLARVEVPTEVEASSAPEAPTKPTRTAWADSSFFEFQDAIVQVDGWTFRAVDRSRWTEDDFTGKVTLVNLWATWCRPCRDELPLMQRLHEELADDDRFQVVTINLDRRKSAVRNYLESHGEGWSFPVLWGHPVFRDSIRRLPQNWLIDAEGVIRRQSTGFAQAEADAWIAGMLAELERLRD